MSAANLWTIVFSAALVASLLTQGWLAARQARHVLGHRDAVPAQFQAAVDLAAHRKAADYTLAKIRLGQLQIIAGAVVLLAWTLFGGLDMLDGVVREAVGLRWHGIRTRSLWSSPS